MRNESAPPLEFVQTGHAPTATPDLTFPQSVLDALLISSPDPIFVVDPQGRYLIVGEAGAQALGLPADQITGKTNREIGFPPEVCDALAEQTAQVFRTGQPVTGAVSLPTATGMRAYEHTLSPLFDRLGDVTAILCIARDVTERQRHFDLLREHDRRLQMALDAAHMGTFEANVPRDEVRLPTVTRRLMGLPADLPISRLKMVYRCVHAEDRRSLRKAVLAAMHSESDFTAELRILLPDRTVRWLACRGRLAPGGSGTRRWLVGVLWDVTERKRAEAEQRRVEEEQRSLMSGAKCMLWHADVTESGREFLLWDMHIPNLQALQRFLPLDVPEDHTYAQVWHRARLPEDRAESDRYGTECVRAGQSYAQEYRCVGADGKIRWIHEDVQIETIEPGKRWHAVGVCTDVTDRILGEESLRASERRLTSALTAGDMGIWELDTREETIALSREAERLFGLAPGTFLGTIAEVVDCVHPDDRHIVHQSMLLAIENHTPYEPEYRVVLPDGGVRWLRSNGTVYYDSDGFPSRVLGIVTDTTHQKRLQAQFLQSQRMEGLGRLAGGIAHDFNNLIAVILGYAEMVQSEAPVGSVIQSHAQIIENAADRAAKLTAQLLAFARQQVSVPKIVGPNDLIAGMKQILKPLIREDIELILCLKEGVGNILADPGQIEQVLVNLVVNARDAIVGGGKIVLQTENVTLTDRLEQTVTLAGDYVLIAVSDTGEGMTEAVKANLFEPFFTTKSIGKGTGLGLSTVYGIVEQSGGYIFVYSEPGIGATFKLYFPRVDSATVSEPTAKTDASKRGSETLLVVEDEPLLRELTVNTLVRNGYTVLEAENGVQALQMVQEFQGEIHLMVTDAIMPEMGGKELADRLSALRPGTRVLYASGYTEDVTAMHGALQSGTDFLQKPFTSPILLSKVRQSLDRT